MRLYGFLLTLFIGINSVYSQTIYGIIKDGKEPLEMVSVTLKNENNNILAYTSSDENGKYSLKADNIEDNYFVVFSKYGYEEQKHKLLKIELTENSLLDVVLKEESEKIKDIKEVVIYQKPKIEETKDTLSYRANAYKDGTERNVEDLIKKLPGMTVDDNGGIKYKGKQIEKVLLEGDDIFNENYTVGTRNISVDMIDQIQAIEKYSENTLLKGVENSDKVALNLKIKKGKMDFSGSSLLAGGFDERYHAETNILSLSKKNKNFTSVSYNNTGDNSSPYDFFSNGNTVGDYKIKQRIIPNVILEPVYSNVLDFTRVNINDNYFGNINNSTKLCDKLNLKLNVSYYKNKFLYDLENNTDYTLEGENIVTSQNEKSTKEPERYDTSYKLTWNVSKSSLLEISSKWFYEKRKSVSEYIINETDFSKGILENKNLFFSQDLLYTSKLNTNQVLQIAVAFSQNDNTQHYLLSPGFDFIQNEIDSTKKNEQNADLRKSFFSLNSVLLGKNKHDKYQITLSANYQDSSIKSLLVSNDFLSQNDITYKIQETNLSAFYNWNLGDFSLTPLVSIRNIFQTIKNRENIDNIVFNPTLQFLYKINNNSKIFSNISVNQQPQQVNNFYDNFVMTSNRSITKNDMSMQFQKKQEISLGYSVYNLMKQFSMSFSATYNNDKNNFFAKTNVSENLTQVTYIFLPEKNTNISLNYMIEKYIPVFQSTFRVNLNYNLYAYRNIVNNSELRDNKYNFLGTELFGKTAFDIPVNFENTFKLQSSISRAEGYSSNKNIFIDNVSKILLKPNKQWIASISLDYFKPSAENTKEYYFLDMDIRYMTKSRIFEFFLTGKNLTGNKYFTEYYITDYYQSYSSQKLNYLYVILGCKFQF